MDHALYSAPVIQQDLDSEETIYQIADAIDYLSAVVRDLFGRIDSRIAENQKKLQALTSRAESAKVKVDKLTGCNKATKVFSSAKYPASDVQGNYESMFKSPSDVTLKHSSVMKHSKSAVIKPLQDKLQFYHVKSTKVRRSVEVAVEEGLGSLPPNIDSVSSLLLFNTSENPYKRYVFIDPLGAVMKTRQALEQAEAENHMEEAPVTITHQEHVEATIGHNFFYTPGLGDVPDIDVPLDLPDLPNIADDLRYSMDLGPTIAPSVTTTPAIPELPIVIAETPVSNTVSPQTDSSLTTLPPVGQPIPRSDLDPASLSQPLPPISTVSTQAAPPPPPPSHQNAVAPAPPPPPPLPPPMAPAAPPPPPPPPPPPAVPESERVDGPGSGSTAKAPRSNIPPAADARATLMDAIRKAGGSGKAKLRSVAELKQEAKKIKQDEKASEGSGDLMADLHAKLSLRRKAISRGWKAAEQGVSGMDRISAMIPPPPPAPEKAASTSATEDEGDWD